MHPFNHPHPRAAHFPITDPAIAASLPPNPQIPVKIASPAAFRVRWSMACGHIHRHTDSPSRHSGASRNLWRVVTFTVIPTPQAVIPVPQTVIPAQAGIYGVWPHYRHTGSPSRHTGSPNRHSGASRNLWRVATLPSYRLPKPSFRLSPGRHTGPPSRHSGASRNLHAAMDSGFRRNDGPIPKPPKRNRYRRQRCVLGGLTFPHSDAARNPALPSGRTSASVSATARLFNPIPKIAPRK